MNDPVLESGTTGHVEPGSVSPVIAGFWRRVLAFVLDCFVVGTVGLVIGTIFFSTVSQMGGWERLIGLAIVLLYAIPLNSRLGGGQTFGKRALDIRVVGKDGHPLSVGATVIRQSVLAIPFFLNNLPISTGVLAQPVLSAVLSAVLFGGLFGVLYLLAFNRHSRQSLHDLAARSWVVRVDRSGDAPVTAAPVWRVHLWLVAAVAVLALVAPFAMLRWFQQSTYSGLLTLNAKLEQIPDVMDARLVDGWQSGGGTTSTYIAVTLHTKGPHGDDEAYFRDAARQVLADYPQAAKRDRIVITTYQGYDMVIASWHFSWTHVYTPSDLK